ncbi:tripartite tricarboxylate transporter substrate binding protein [Bordetella sp. BOR01]|uniref:Bug family tripartite tricarboxylate transporter substrate binding protein n=1 Tax=Bordetella sp. BOR01 TaxID=2854779 RepID=UPI001C488DD5|nr:tripartite tricarboxylate transporter substrate binding protein [Bordetella sp. BOR01]MBV7484858.1 tripartite tricarboxylate transporter substrate binding protein [Bordetella sp. BOR01]
MSRIKTAYRLLAITSVLLAGGTAQAQQYPERPINVVVPFPPGGPVDTLARILSKSMSASLGQQIIIENKPGAGGSIGAAQVARSAADGYTLLMTASSFAMDPAIRSNLPFDPREDMHGVANVASGPVVLLAKKTLPVDTFPELLQLLKKEPGKLAYASTGIGTVNHFAGELLKSAAKVDALHVPYNGAAPATQAIVAGEVDFFFNNVLSSVPLVAADKVKALAVTSEERWPAFPDVPTLRESGVPVEISSWYGYFAPAGTPPSVMQKFYAEVNKALAAPEVKQQIERLGLKIEGMGPDEFQIYVDKEIDKWAAVAKSAGIQPQ